MIIDHIKDSYQNILVKPRKHINFWILLSFLPTFLISRMMVYIAHDLFINLKGVHIHHLTYGIFILAIAGFLSQNLENQKWKEPIAIIYGIGLALSFDEFGMWLRLQDSYWIRQSYDAMLIILSLLINVVYFSNFWLRIISLPQKFKIKLFK
jgi:hypothetical protein